MEDKTSSEPFSNSKISLKFRQLLHDIGIEPTPKDKIPWKRLPFLLHLKGYYISGLPARLFLGDSEPTPELLSERVNKDLHWPPSDIEDPKVVLAKAVEVPGGVTILRRPPGRDVVFEVVTKTGKRIDIGEWKTRKPSKLSEMEPTKALETPYKEPFPAESTIPLRLREILQEAGVKDSIRRPGHIPWLAVPQTLWSNGLYISGIPVGVFEGKASVKQSKLSTITSRPLAIMHDYLATQLSDNDFTADKVMLLRRPPGRNVVFEVKTSDGTFDIGKWEWEANTEVNSGTSSTETSSSDDEPFRGSSNVPIRLRKILGDHLDTLDPQYILIIRTLEKAGVPPDSEGCIPWQKIPHILWEKKFYITGLPHSLVVGNNSIAEVTRMPLHWTISATMNDLLNRRFDYNKIRLLQREKDRKVVFEVKDETGQKVDIGPWTDGTFDAATSIGNERTRWFNEVAAVTDELAKLFRSQSIPLPKHKSRPDALGIPWADLPRLLHEARVTWTGVPLEILPYWYTQSRLSGKWTTVWNRAKLDTIKERLDNGTMTIQPWENSSKFVVHAIDDNAKPYNFTYDDFLNAKTDNPETLARDGNVSRPIVISFKKDPRKRIESEDEDDLGEATLTPDSNPAAIMPKAKKPNFADYPGVEMYNLLASAGVTIAQTPGDTQTIPWNKLRFILNANKITLRGVPYDCLPVDGQGRLRKHWRIDKEKAAKMQQAIQEGTLTAAKWPSDDTGIIIVTTNLGKEYHFKFSDFGLADRSTRTMSERELFSSSTGDEERLPVSRRTDSVYTEDFNLPQPEHDPKLTGQQLNAKYRAQKEAIKSFISLLIYENIPCIAPEEHDFAFFLPWENLPRHLAAKEIFISGFPSVCAPVVEEDEVLIQSGPWCWSDDQWLAFQDAINNKEIVILKATKRILFELVGPDHVYYASKLEYSNRWFRDNFGSEMGHGVSIFADRVGLMDAIVQETDNEYETDFGGRSDVTMMNVDSDDRMDIDTD